MPGSAAVLKTEARLFRREPGAVFWLVVFPTALLVVIGLVPPFQKPDEALGGLRVIDLYVPVAVLLAMITAGVQTMPAVLTTYRERGILRRLAVTPARPSSLLTAQIVLHGCAIALSVLIALTVGRLAFGVALPRAPFAYLLAMAPAALAALALGAAICAVSRTTRIAQALGTAVFFPMMFSAGVWTPVQAMPELVQRIVGFTPFGAASQALGQASAGDWPDWSHLAVTAGWAVLLVAVAIRWFRWE